MKKLKVEIETTDQFLLYRFCFDSTLENLPNDIEDLLKVINDIPELTYKEETIKIR